jgi:hypothetical protein
MLGVSQYKRLGRLSVSDNFELTLSFLVVIFLGGVYIVYEAVSTPAGGHPFGHALGILGALLMVMTEVLYSARKRWRIFTFGRMRHWLSFHIFTGIVGPALVLMHTGLAFRGLAGLTMLLTVLVVASGFLGRYIYTAVPRTMGGMEVERRSLEAQAAHRQEELLAWAAARPERVQSLVRQETALALGGGDLSPLDLMTRRLREWQERRRLHAAILQLEKEEKRKATELERVLQQQQRLRRQIGSLQAVGRMMVWWRALHVPLGLTLFTAMFIHIFAAVYFVGI